jgi:hypothetical protein
MRIHAQQGRMEEIRRTYRRLELRMADLDHDPSERPASSATSCCAWHVPRTTPSASEPTGGAVLDKCAGNANRNPADDRYGRSRLCDSKPRKDKHR